MSRSLYISRAGAPVGTIRQGAHHLELVYEPAYLRAPNAVPLSASLPLREKPHSHSRVERFVWNLVPENEAVLASLQSEFRIRNLRDPLEVLARIGEDAPGAFQYSDSPDSLSQVGVIERMSEAMIASELRGLQHHRASGRNRVSLAGY